MRTASFEGALLRRFGPGRCRKILCLPAFADDGTAFTDLGAAAIAERYELIVCDLPGFGASPPLPGNAAISACAEFVVRLADAVSPDRAVGVIAHSLSAAVAVEAALRAPERFAAILSIEGNITAADAYLSGQAATYDDAETFKAAFADRIWTLAQSDPTLRRYHRAVRTSNAQAMWALGRDAVLRGADDAFGMSYLRLADRNVATLYLWSRRNTSQGTAAFIDRHVLPNYEFAVSGHWKASDAPEETSRIALTFFDSALEALSA